MSNEVRQLPCSNNDEAFATPTSPHLNNSENLEHFGGGFSNNDVGQLKYDQVRNAGIHAVSSAGGTNYSYDKYDNMTARGSESIIYDTFKKPVRIAGSAIKVSDSLIVN